MSVVGGVDDDDFSEVTVYIDWLGETYETDVDQYGYFYWYIALGPGDEGWITATAEDSEGQSEPWRDLVIP